MFGTWLRDLGAALSNIETLALEIANRLRDRGETIAVAESSAGGLISAALLAVPGASAYFLGGAVVYTRPAKSELLAVPEQILDKHRSASEPHALALAQTARERLGANWGLAETGAAGPGGNRYGDAAGHTCIAIVGSTEIVRTIETGDGDRAANMERFTEAALALAAEVVKKTS